MAASISGGGTGSSGGGGSNSGGSGGSVSGLFNPNKKQPHITLYKRDDLENLSPSHVHHHISIEDERMIRKSWSRLIQQAGLRLELPTLTTATAIAYFQRFYCRVSFVDYDPFRTAQAVLFLASKVEENGRRVRDIINTTYRLQHPRLDEPPLQVSKQYWDMKEEVIGMEQTVLRVLNYELEVRHSHQYVLQLVRELNGSDEIANLSFCLCNDLIAHTTLPLQYTPHALAVSALFVANELLTATNTERAGPNTSVPASAAAGGGGGSGAAGSGGGGGGASPYAADEKQPPPYLKRSSLVTSASGGGGSVSHLTGANGEWWERFEVSRFELEEICKQLLDAIESEFTPPQPPTAATPHHSVPASPARTPAPHQPQTHHQSQSTHSSPAPPNASTASAPLINLSNGSAAAGAAGTSTGAAAAAPPPPPQVESSVVVHSPNQPSALQLLQRTYKK